MNRLELYEIALANCESDKDVNFVLEMSADDELLTDEEYTLVYEKAETKLKRWMWGAK